MKRIAPLTLTLLLFTCARGDYIFPWEVDLGDGSKTTFSYVSMYVGEGSDKSTYNMVSTASDSGSDSGAQFVEVKGGASDDGGTSTDPVWAYLGEESAANDPSKKSFYFELYDAGFGFVGSTILSDFSDYTVWTTGTGLGNLGSQGGPSTFTVTPDMLSTPEPTSGLLMLFGLAGLALKRKHVDSKPQMKGAKA